MNKVLPSIFIAIAGAENVRCVAGCGFNVLPCCGGGVGGGAEVVVVVGVVYSYYFSTSVYPI